MSKGYEELRDLSEAGLRKLNDHLRYLYWATKNVSENDVRPETGNRIIISNNTSIVQLVQDTTNIESAIGDRVYTEENYTTTGESLTASIDALDTALGASLTLSDGKYREPLTNGSLGDPQILFGQGDVLMGEVD